MRILISIEGRSATVEEEFHLGGITVPKGFTSDGISSPRWAWLRYHPYSEWCPAAFVHDYCIEKFGYPTARNYFKVALQELGAGNLDIVLIYNAVRLRDWQRRVFNRLGL